MERTPVDLMTIEERLEAIDAAMGGQIWDWNEIRRVIPELFFDSTISDEDSDKEASVLCSPPSSVQTKEVLDLPLSQEDLDDA